jgi:hypothetical protein
MMMAITTERFVQPGKRISVNLMDMVRNDYRKL